MDVQLSSEIISGSPSLSDWLIQSGRPDLDATVLQHQIESDLIQQATYFSLLQFWQHEQTGIWGEVGEDASRLSFTRIILQIPEDLTVEISHITQLNAQLPQLYADFNITDVPLDTIKDRLGDYRFKLAGMEFQLHDSEWINQLLQFIGSDLCIQSGDYGHERELILGHGKTFQFDEYRVVDLTSEVMRTANMVTSLAAAIGHNQIFVRHASLQGIFQLKWDSFISYPYRFHESPEFEAGHQLKALTCNVYDIRSLTDLADRKTEFLKDMRENILFHELGHAVIQHRLLPTPIATFSEASKIISHPFIHSLLELLAEIAPKNGAILGPLWNIAQVARTTPSRAARMFWMYMSDTWFFDTADDYMYFYSDLVALTFGAAIDVDGTLDFDHFESVVWGKNGVLEMTLKTVEVLCQTIMSEMEPLIYTIENQEMSFIQANQWIKTTLVEENAQDSSEYLQQTAQWHQLLNIALENKDFEHQTLTMLEEQSHQFMSRLAEKTGFTGNNPRHKVIERILKAI
jgi:hypothetical protein